MTAPAEICVGPDSSAMCPLHGEHVADCRRHSALRPIERQALVEQLQWVLWVMTTAGLGSAPITVTPRQAEALLEMLNALPERAG